MMWNAKEARRRTAAFVGSVVLISAAVWVLERLGHLEVTGEYSSQTLLTPSLCGYLLWNHRERILAGMGWAPAKGAKIAIGALICGLGAVYFHMAGDAYLFSVTAMLSAILLVVAIFVALYGLKALSRAIFPFFMLLLAIPFPDWVVQRIISILQAQSASLSATLFSLIGIPVFRQGFLLTVPGLTIEVARECSGINSSIALVLTMLLVARESLSSKWRRAVLVVAAVPLSIFTNAIRITTLTVLALRVDPGFLTGKLHRRGGFVFYLIAMALMYPMWGLLKKHDGPERYSEEINIATANADGVFGTPNKSIQVSSTR